MIDYDVEKCNIFPNLQIIRVQSPNGMKKIPATKKETAAAFLNKVLKYGCMI